MHRTLDLLESGGSVRYYPAKNEAGSLVALLVVYMTGLRDVEELGLKPQGSLQNRLVLGAV